jgi:hypothetical protein
VFRWGIWIVLVLDDSCAGSFSAVSRHIRNDYVGEFMEAKCNPCDSVCGERFPGRFVLKKNFLIIDILGSIVSLENIGVIGRFSEVASPFKASLGSS